MADINQENINAGGDVVAGNKNVFENCEVHIEREKNHISLRNSFEFLDNEDKDNTILKRKLNDGELNSSFINKAIEKKIKTLSLILQIKKMDIGKGYLNDMYENLVTLFDTKYLHKLENGDLLKEVEQFALYEDLQKIKKDYEDRIPVDEAFIEGLLYVATSNCAIKWRIE